MPPLLFPEPITVFEAPAARRRLRSVEEAARWMLEHWPGAKPVPAQAVLLRALEGKATPGQARMAFAAAARQAGILLV